MPPVIINLTATTELEAFNAMLASIGEAPYTDLSNLTAADAAMALNILRDTTREVQSMAWKFNTEFGFEIAPSATYAWVDTAGVTTSLNIFRPPTGLSGFSVSQVDSQQGCRQVDTEIRPSRKYQVASAFVQVFYDRRNARDGFPAVDYPFLYINPIWLFGFEAMPEVARAYVFRKAGRRFQASVVGSQTLYQFTTQDESVALRNLKREQGEEDEYNMLQTGDVRRARGGRPGGWSGFTDSRKNRNSV